MITKESIIEKMGFNPLTHDFGYQAIESENDPPDAQKWDLLTKEELDFVGKWALEEREKKKAQKRY